LKKFEKKKKDKNNESLEIIDQAGDSILEDSMIETERNESS
jgi:hypothetical protein